MWKYVPTHTLQFYPSEKKLGEWKVSFQAFFYVCINVFYEYMYSKETA